MSEIIIRIDGVDVTPHVLLADAVFTTQAGGSPGTCKFRIKDLNMSRSIVIGKELTLDIDGERVWGGYVMKCGRNFFFPVMDTSRRPCDPLMVVPRAFVVEGVDYNILLMKRFMVDKANPKRVELKSYPAGTHDDVIIREYAQDYLYLGGDGLDTTTMVEHVGTPNPDKKGNPAAGGYSWQEALQAISRLTGAVDYIDPDKRLVHTDVDTPNAPFGLSDNPGPGQIGYRDLDILADATSMRNDALVWGAGQGADRVKFERTIDQDSIDDHNRWQIGDFRFDMWRQESVRKRSRSFVYGSPQNKRGGKDDAMSAMVTVKEPGFRVAHKVEFESQIYGYADVIPIRRLTVIFVSPTQALFNLTLSHYIDEPWNIFEFWFPDFNFPFPPIIIPPIEGSGAYPNCPVPGGVPLFSDRFDRPPGQPADCGRYDYLANTPTVPDQINEDQADLNNFTIRLDSPYAGGFEVLLGLDLTDLFGDAEDQWGAYNPQVMIWTGNGSGPGSILWVVSKDDPNGEGPPGGYLQFYPGEVGAEMVVEVGAAMTAGRVFVKLHVDATGYHMKVWPQSQAEPGEQLWAPPLPSGTVATLFTVMVNAFPYDPAVTLPADSIGVFGLSTAPGHQQSGGKLLPAGSVGDDPTVFEAEWGVAPPHDGIFFGYSNPPTQTLTPIFVSGDGTPSTLSHPGFSMVMGHEQFTDEDMTLAHVTERQTGGIAAADTTVNSASGDLPTAQPGEIVVTGEVSAGLSSGGIGEAYAGGQPPVGFSVDFVFFPNGKTPPYIYPHQISGRNKATILVSGRGYGTTDFVEPVWYPFTFTVTDADLREADGLFVWGARISDPVSAAAAQPTMGGGFLLPTLRSISLGFRNVSYEIKYTGQPCGSHFCTPESAAGGTNQSKTCEIRSERSGSFATTREFLANTVEVWADGIMLRPNIDFAEVDTQHVILLADVGTSSTIKVCYLPAVINGTSTIIVGSS